MKLTQLDLENFRNFAHAQWLTLNPQLNLIVGQNGQGKSNLLEAIYLLGTGFSPRTNRVREVIKWGEDYARIRTELANDEVVLFIRSSVKNFYHGAKKIQFSQLNDWLKVVYFHPPDMNLLVGSPSVRRRYLDRLLSQMHYEYLYWLINYRRLLAQRNTLLKQVMLDAALLDVVEDRMVEYGVKIVTLRVGVIGWLNQIIAAQALQIVYQMSPRSMQEIMREMLQEILREKLELVDLAESNSLMQYQDILREKTREKLRQLREKEQRIGFTLIGPQRDDFSLIHLRDPGGEIDLGLYGSRGEQRMGVIYLKLGECDLIESRYQQRPILLLDDVFSELDAENQALLSKFIPAQQTFITSTDNNLAIPAEFPQNSRIDL